MPADPIEFRIMQSLQTALKNIKTADGYHHTVKGLAVKFDPDHEVEDLVPGANSPIGPLRPFIVLEVSPDSFEYTEHAKTANVRLPFVVHIIHDSDVQDDDSRMLTYFKLCADVESAIVPDQQRGGLATATTILGRRQRDRAGTEVWAQIAGEVRTHRGFGAPNG